jgi:hypothetical protein
MGNCGAGELNAASTAGEDEGPSCGAVSLWASPVASAAVCSEATAGGVGTKNFAPDSGLTDGAAGLLYIAAAPKAFAPPPPLLKVSTYLDKEENVTHPADKHRSRKNNATQITLI